MIKKFGRGPLYVVLGLSVALGSACTTVRAAKPIERPALEVPPPPPRVIAPLPLPDLPVIEPVMELPTNNKPESPRSRAQRERNEPKPEPKPETPPVEPPAAAAPAPAAPVLRTAEGSDATQNQIRAAINNARSILDKTNYPALKNELKNAYDQAQLFAKQADDALTAKNFVYAKELAEKAERLAKELQSR
jgi:hypothetical protein